MNLFYVLLFLIILCAGAGIVYVVYYNKMQYLKTKIEHSESIIDETLRVRYDLLVHADNIVKIVLDAMNKFAFKVDTQVTKLEIEKKYDKTPRIYIKIEEY